MLLEVVDVCLLYGSEISDAPRGACQTEVNGEHLSERWRGTDGGGHDVMVIIALREYLVVSLSVVGREHQSCERSRRLIADNGRIMGAVAGAY